MAKTWGSPTWMFFHTLAEKIRPEFYETQRGTIITFIQRICANLPCPVCREHAMAYTRSLNERAVPTKQALQAYLFVFHNKVNERLKKPIFKDFDIYKTKSLRECYFRFEIEFLKNNILSRNFFDQQHRRNLIVQLRSYLSTNSPVFEW